jgi:single-stranded-DNA-specific exonuclease
VLLADAIAARKRMVIIADYDCDGATACAVGLRGIRLLAQATTAPGVDLHFIVPNRFEYGYGLTPEIVQLAQSLHQPDLLITVDNGIASVDGVAEANRLGIQVLVTDHHLPGDQLPEAACIVNPNQPGCTFPSKNIAGVGVMFYVLLALRAELRQRGAFVQPEPRLDALLDLVALGTVADVVKLDANNRRLVAQGLKRMQAGRMQPGIAALFHAAGREARSAAGFDLGFALGPRLNAAGRLADMSLGIECLTTDDAERAFEIAQQLDNINRERRSIEADMQESALAAIEELGADLHPEERATLCLFDPAWHQGVVGIVASRLKDKFHRPTITFAPAGDGTLRGSGRSIPGLHLRDALDLVSKRAPGLILKFGGHAMAAGLSINEDDFDVFAEAFEAAVRATLSPALLTRTLEHDGPLDEASATLQTVRELDAQVWGQGFPAPLFSDVFQVENQRLLKDKHLKLVLKKLNQSGAQTVDAIWFNHADTLPTRARIVYRLAENTYNGVSKIQLLVEHAEPLTQS